MKTRVAHVSNSSSCSFCIHGVSIDNDEAERLNIPDDLFAGSNDYDTYIGIPYDTMKMDETRRQFEERAAIRVREVFGKDIKTSYITAGWYDG